MSSLVVKFLHRPIKIKRVIKMTESTNRFQFNPAEVSANTQVILDDGEYLFKIAGVNASQRDRENPDGTTTDLYGFGVRLEVLEGPSNVGRSIFQNFFLHSEAAHGMVKQFLMAAYGFDGKDEAGFNEFATDKIWDNDYEAKTVGSGYSDMIGRTIGAYAKTKPNKNDASQMQNQFRWNVVS